MNNYELNPGTLVDGRYMLKECKGNGSFGEVWLAEDTKLCIDIAIKLYISLDQKGQDEFKDEYKVAYGLSHENLLTTQYYSVWEHRPYLIMKYCSQGSSNNLAGNASEAQIWKFIHDVANGLKYLHAQEPSIIHQDIKPANILVDDQGNFLITDFGISKKMRTTMRKQSRRAIGSGAIAYMGPERFLKDPMAVKASDIWSLGVSIYELATNELPFLGQGGGMLNAGAAIPELDNSKWSHNLNKIMQVCLSKDTWNRPTAEDLSDYTQLMLKGKDITWDQWKAGALEPTSKPKKWLIPTLVTTLLLAIIISILTYNSKGSDNERISIEQRYSNLKSMCENNIKVGSAENYTSLLEAQSLMDSLVLYKSNYEYLTAWADSLKPILSTKIENAHQAWIRSAKGQYEIAEDVGSAISYYHIAAMLKKSSEVTNALCNLARRSSCSGAYMIVTSWETDGNKLKVYYNGLDNSIGSTTIRYKLSSGSHSNAIQGQANIRIEPGDGRTLVISINGSPNSIYNHLRLSNNGITFYNQDISR